MPQLPRLCGVEIECGGGRIGRDALQAALIAAGLPARTSNYESGLTDVWRCGTDSSIRLDNGVELASPPLDNTAPLVTALKVLRDNRFTVNDSCGLHVHVDFVGRGGVARINLPVLQRLCKLWLKYERLMFQWAGPNRMSSNYCRPIGFGRADGRGMKDLWEMIDTAHCAECLARNLPQGVRMNSLNLDALWRHGTIEFRLHKGSLDETDVVNWVTLLSYLVELAYAPGKKLLPRVGAATNLVAALRRLDDGAVAARALFQMGKRNEAVSYSRLDPSGRVRQLTALKGDAEFERHMAALKAESTSTPIQCLRDLDAKSKVAPI